MKEDRYGLELTTSSADARDAYVDAVDRMLAGNGGVEQRLLRAIKADPDFALAHAALGRNHQLSGRDDVAKGTISTASGLVHDATGREKQHVEIFAHLVSGQTPAALELTRQHVKEFPRDALALAPSCGVFGSIGFSGRIDREAELLALLEPLAVHYGDDWWFSMVYSFALTEVGQWGRGRELVEQSLDQFRQNPNAAHTLAHALYEAGDDDTAARFLSGWLPELKSQSPMYCHIWWHYALLLMAKGDFEQSRQAFREHCLPGGSASSSINFLTDSASFLWRSELAGAPTDVESWEAVSDYYATEFGKPGVFIDAHIGLSMAALGRAEEVESCVLELQELAAAGRLPAGRTAADLTRAYDAFASEDWGRAIDLLEATISEVVRIGGSRAQRDLVTNTLLAAYVNAGRLDDATDFLQRVHDRQPFRPVLGLV